MDLSTTGPATSAAQANDRIHELVDAAWMLAMVAALDVSRPLSSHQCGALASVAGIRLGMRRTLTMLDGLAERLAAPGAELLDVGVGTGGMMSALYADLPTLRGTGIDVLPQPLQLAKRMAADFGVAGRVELRLQSVAELDDRERYDMAWLPAMFIPPAAVYAGLPRLLAALRPGGWLVLAAVTSGRDAFSDAVTAWRVARDGGTAVPVDEMVRRLRETGFVDVRRLPVPPGAPAILGARRG